MRFAAAILLACLLRPGLADAEVTVLHGAAALKTVLHSFDAGDHPLVVHFFATWCDDCVRELPLLRKAVDAARAQGASVLFVSLDPPEGGSVKIERLLKAALLDVPVYLLDAPDPEPVAALLQVSWSGGLPATFVLFRGQRTASFIGPLRDPSQLVGAVRTAANHRAAPQ